MTTISLYESERETEPATLDLTWAELVDSLSQPRITGCGELCGSLQRPLVNKCSERKGQAWSPAITDGHRGDAHVQGMDLIVLDLDHLTQVQALAFDERLKASGFAYICHTTHSHAPEFDDYCYRLVLRCSRRLTPAEIVPTRDAVQAQLGLRADEQTKNLERLYFSPSIQTGREYGFEAVEGTDVAPAAGTLGAVVSRGSTAPPTAYTGPALSTAEAMTAIRGLGRSNEKVREIVERILNGECLAAPGHRDDDIHRVCRSMGYNLLGAEIPLLMHILTPSLAQVEPPEPGQQSWFEKAQSALEQGRDEGERYVTEKKALARAHDRHLASVSAKFSKAPEDKLEAEISEMTGEPMAQFTDERIKKWAAEQGVEPELWGKRWIIRMRGANWVWCSGAYEGAIPDGDLLVSLPRDLARAPGVNLYHEDGKGNRTPKSVIAICSEYGEVARDAVASLSLQHSFYNGETQTFHEAVCPLRPLKPEYNEEIHQWITLMGGDALLDWVASVSRLDLMSAGVYLEGDKGTGKGTLANGLARLWHKGSPTEYKDVVSSNFNDSLCRCPLIFADEGLPQGDQVGNQLRTLIGSNSRSLNRKFLPTMPLDGAVRLIVSANNQDGLLLSDTGLGRRDIDAISERILHISSPKESATYLKSFLAAKGQTYIGRWISDDLIAKHALWLRDNRAVDMNKRFLASGEANHFHERLMTSTGVVALVLEFIARFLSDVSTKGVKTFRAGGGKLLVNASVLGSVHTLKVYAAAHKIPTAPQIAEALREISKGDTQFIDGLTFNDINLETLERWVKANGVGEWATIAARVAA